MAGGNLKTIDPNQYPHAPLRGVLLVDVADDYLHPQGYLDILTGVAAADKGRHIANLAEAPTATETDERVNPFEDLYGKTADVVGEEQIQSTRVEIGAQLVSLTLKNMKLLRPDFQFSEVYGPDGTFASLDIGTGAAGVRYTAKTKGTGGNSIRVAHVNPNVANTPLSVAVSGNDITVTLANGATAGTITSTAAQVRDAVNAHAAAAALVSASLVGDGTGTAVAQAITALLGGSNGTVVGIRMKRTLVLSTSDYLKNIVLAASTSDRTIGRAIILRKAINVNEDREYSFEDDMSVFGVEATWRAHSEASSMDPATGLLLPNFEEHTYTETVIPA